MVEKLLMQKKIIFLVSMLIFSLPALAINYYCPQSDVSLQFNDFGVQGSELTSGISGYSEPFPKALSEVGISAGRLNFSVSNCDTSEMYCLRFESPNKSEQTTFFLFLPRVLEVGKEYSFKGAKLLTQIASNSTSEEFFIQGIIWQSIGGQSIPMKMTITRDRGVIYWDGLDFWAGKFSRGETCIAETKKGFFSNVKVKKITTTKQTIE
jgi:hypothetical protein